MNSQPLKIGLCFHFNQNLNQHSFLASQVCYKGLLNVLRRHPRLPFAIHISGTLIHALQWFDPEPLQLMADGLAAGQFTLLGSTYAQNVPYASDDWDNLLQIALHKEILQRTFGVTPTFFWNSERCWRQSLVPVISGSGYTHTLIEGGFLQAAGCSQPHAVWKTRVDNDTLTLFNDDQPLKTAVNYAIWTGRPQRALDRLRALYEQPESHSSYVWYAEDAEATGLWGYSGGILPQSAWHHLDAFLTQLEQQPWLAVVSPSDAPPAAGDLPEIPDGQATWMINSLDSLERPYHEAGYRDWLDFNQRAEKLTHFRQLFTRVRTKLQQAQSENSSNPASARLLAQALFTFAAHQFEFGCIGIGGIGDRQWEMTRAALVCLRASFYAREPAASLRVWQEDVNDDGIAEILLLDAHQFIVLTAFSGRILYAFDLAEGVSWVGNENAMPPVGFENDNAYPVLEKTTQSDWLPQSFDVALEKFSAQEVDPRPLWGHFLPADWFDDEPKTLPTYFLPPDSFSSHKILQAQGRALCDRIWLNDEEILRPEDNVFWNATLTDSDATFTYKSAGLQIEKRVALYAGGLDILYRISPLRDEFSAIRLVIENELCPAGIDLLDSGRQALSFWQVDGSLAFDADAQTRGVLNQSAKYLVVLQMQPQPASVSGGEGLFSLHLSPSFEGEVKPGDSLVVGLRWRALKIG